MSKARICAVVMTHNSPEVYNCVVAIFCQSRLPDKIIVVNSCSSSSDVKFPSVIQVINIPDVSPSFNVFAAVFIGYLSGCDFVWLLDDSCIPDKDCLHALLATAKNGFRIVSPQFYSFSGILIRSDAISKYGLPDPKFYMYGDDSEYTMRVGWFNECREAIITHNKDNTFDGLSEEKTFLFWKSMRVMKQHLWREFCIRRNGTYLGKSNLKSIIYAFFGILLFDSNKLLRWKILFKGTIDGLLGRFDNGYIKELRKL